MLQSSLPLSVHQSTVPKPLFPIEVSEVVIDQAGDDPASLRGLSLTCAAFLPRARCHLFAGLLIRTVEQLQSSSDFLDLHPWAPPLIQRVTLFSEGEPRFGGSGHLLDVVPVHLLSRLPNLRVWKMAIAPDSWSVSLFAPHPLALSCYQKYGSHIESLELTNTSIRNLSTLYGFVSCLTNVRKFICSNIGLEMSMEGKHPDLSRMKGKSLKLQSLRVSASVDFFVIDFLLASSAASLKNLAIVFNSWQVLEKPYLERLQNLMGRLSRLACLTFGILCSGVSWGSPLDNYPWKASKYIRHAIGILAHVNKVGIEDIRVEFTPEHMASLGCPLSMAHDGHSTIVLCRELEEALLTFSSSRLRILVNHPLTERRVGRVELWSPYIKRCFPRLNERGLLTLPCTPAHIPEQLGHEAEVACIVPSHDSTWIATASPDGTIIIWNAECGAIAHQWVAHQGPVTTLILSPNGRRLASIGGVRMESELRLWDLTHSGVHRIAMPDGHIKPVTACAWSPDGMLIASASEDQIIHVLDARTFQLRDQTKACPDDFDISSRDLISGPRCLQFSPDSRYLAWIPGIVYPACCVVWRPLMQEQPQLLHSSPKAPIYADSIIKTFAFNPESKWITATHGWSNYFGPYQDSSDDDNALTYNASKLGSFAAHHAIKVWDVASGTLLSDLAARRDGAAFCDTSFSADGSFMLSSAYDGSAIIWDTKSWKKTASLKRPSSRFHDSQACFFGDGMYVTSGDLVRLQRADGGAYVVNFADSWPQDSDMIACTPDGRFLVCGEGNGLVHIRSVSSLKPINN